MPSFALGVAFTLGSQLAQVHLLLLFAVSAGLYLVHTYGLWSRAVSLWHATTVSGADQKLSSRDLPQLDTEQKFLHRWRANVAARRAEPIVVHAHEQSLRFSRAQAEAPATPERFFQLGYNWSMLTAVATDAFRSESKEEGLAAKRFFWDDLAKCMASGALGTFALVVQHRCDFLGLHAGVASGKGSSTLEHKDAGSVGNSTRTDGGSTHTSGGSTRTDNSPETTSGARRITSPSNNSVRHRQ